MLVFKKKHSEIIALYKLESAITDIYVEGNTDRVFIETFLQNKKSNKKVFPIEIVDFSDLPIDYFEGFDFNSNKTKVSILSKLLQEKVPNSKVRCIVDKDFDNFIKSITNEKLLKTDFSCLESYLFCEVVIEKFLKIGIGNFPFSSGFILSELSKVLKSLFCLRLLRELNFREAQLLTIDGNLSINKQDGTINFNEKDYLDKFINKNNLSAQKEKISAQYYKLSEKMNLEIRHYINGHDFIDIFFLYINKIKNTNKYKEENFGRVLFLAVESPMVEDYPFFQRMIL
jgi:hypothetical protein